VHLRGYTLFLSIIDYEGMPKHPPISRTHKEVKSLVIASIAKVTAYMTFAKSTFTSVVIWNLTMGITPLIGKTRAPGSHQPEVFLLRPSWRYLPAAANSGSRFRQLKFRNYPCLELTVLFHHDSAAMTTRVSDFFCPLAGATNSDIEGGWPSTDS
jgi:hypothetical protein